MICCSDVRYFGSLRGLDGFENADGTILFSCFVERLLRCVQYQCFKPAGVPFSFPLMSVNTYALPPIREFYSPNHSTSALALSDCRPAIKCD